MMMEWMEEGRNVSFTACLERKKGKKLQLPNIYDPLYRSFEGLINRAEILSVPKYNRLWTQREREISIYTVTPVITNQFPVILEKVSFHYKLISLMTSPN